jgi:glutamate-1-semialdehyde 2,1-aminomutase
MGPTVTPESPAADRLYATAARSLPGGVSAAARVHRALGRPFFVSRGEGPRVWDLDDRPYLDFSMSHGASLLGHGHPAIRAAVEDAIRAGILCSFETPYHAETAAALVDVIPSAESVRFTGSGTETTWHAIRIARGSSGKTRIVKFEGHFHGYNDVLGYSMWPDPAVAGPANAPVAIPESAGMAAAAAEDIIILPWNDADVVADTLERHGPTIAAVIMEPVNHNCGGLLPQPGYLERVRELTLRHGVLLIFDEIISGFRAGVGGAQAHYGVTPDLTTLGKALGGGTPMSAVVGSRAVMEAVAPLGRVVHSGTYNAHLIPLLATRAFLAEVSRPSFWIDMLAKEERFYPRLQQVLDTHGVTAVVTSSGARFSILFGLRETPLRYRDTLHLDRDVEDAFYREVIKRGVYFHSSPHHGFSSLHTMDDLDEALNRIEDAAKAIGTSSVGRSRASSRGLVSAADRQPTVAPGS